jgi:hypothetical protein
MEARRFLQIPARAEDEKLSVLLGKKEDKQGNSIEPWPGRILAGGEEISSNGGGGRWRGIYTRGFTAARAREEGLGR